MQCRVDCGACCIALSISSPIPGMSGGKAAGITCVQLDAQKRCRLFGQAQRPDVCGALQPSVDICGESAAQAMELIAALEVATEPR